MRLFVALAIPESVRLSLTMLQTGIPDARWQTREQFHITLRFLGDVDGAQVRDVDDMLSGIHAPSFDVELKGAGEFGHEKPHAIWADIAPNDALMHLQKKVDRAMQQIGIEFDKHGYKPHITLAYLRGTPPGIVVDWLADHARFSAPPFAASSFILYSSQLTDNGSKYRVERSYPLGEYP
jgi:2'-5' RNA ligase